MSDEITVTSLSDNDTEPIEQAQRGVGRSHQTIEMRLRRVEREISDVIGEVNSMRSEVANVTQMGNRMEKMYEKLDNEMGTHFSNLSSDVRSIHQKIADNQLQIKQEVQDTREKILMTQNTNLQQYKTMLWTVLGGVTTGIVVSNIADLFK